jgi:D-glycero-D-manno-heptose 1,7-bisphosphate phosphatase
MHTNQSGIARGYYKWSDVYACNQRMHEDFGWPNDFFSKVCIAPESPEETGGYRKPSPRFEKEMIEEFQLEPKECWVIGDKWLDPQTGLHAGMSGALVKTGKPIDEYTLAEAKKKNIPVYGNVTNFVNERILNNE